MTVCLVTHNTGIAQSSPDPLLCDTRWSKFSSLLMHGRRRKKNCEKPKQFAPDFGGSWHPQAYPFKFEENHCRKKRAGTFFFSTIILTVALGCLVITTEVRGSWHSETKKMWIPPLKPLRNWQIHGWRATPHSAHFTEKVGGKSEGVKVVEIWLGKRRHWGRVGRRGEHEWIRDKEKLDHFSQKCLIGFWASVAPN